jgi:hypothetical protein
MQIDNKKQVGLLSLLFPLSIVALFIALAMFYFSDFITSKDVAIGLWIILAIVVILYRFAGFEFVSITFQDNKIDLKYYRLFPAGRKYNRVLIPFDALGKYEIQNGFGGLFSKLILYQKTKGTLAKYPGVGIAALPHRAQKQLMQQFTRILNS